MAKFIKINENDNVAVALEVLPANITIYVDDTEVTTTMEIPVGHKFALVDMAEGESVVKYGFCIGNATSAVKKGDGIHIHNLKTRLGDLLDYIYGPDFVEEKVCE